MVLCWWWPMWICSVSYFWVESMEKHVCALIPFLSFFLISKCWYICCYVSIFSVDGVRTGPLTSIALTLFFCFMKLNHETIVNINWLECLIFFLQILLWFQHDICWSRNDLFSYCQFIIAFWCCGFMGHYVAINQSTKRKLVHWKFTRE